jgi:hypothetical protein
MKNSKKLLGLLAFALCNIIVFAQDSTVVKTKDLPWYMKGTVNGRIFANFHTSASELGKEKAFEVNRAYFGYDVDIDKNFSAAVKLDIGNPTDFKDGGDLVVGKRFAYCKNAYLQYIYENLKVQFGIADAFQFKVQEKAWGYRYILSSFQDVYKYGSSADIGLFASYKFTDWLNADYSLINGEGYGSVQMDDILKNTLGITVNPVKPLTLRLYADNYSISDSSQSTLATFAGVKFDKFNLGAEYNYQINNGLRKGYDQSGYSFYGTYVISNKFKVLGRYDHAESVLLEGATNPWNIKKDGDFLIGGLEYSPIKSVNFALNYQHKLAASVDYKDVASIYFNLQVSF